MPTQRTPSQPLFLHALDGGDMLWCRDASSWQNLQHTAHGIHITGIPDGQGGTTTCPFRPAPINQQRRTRCPFARRASTTRGSASHAHARRACYGQQRHSDTTERTVRRRRDHRWTAESLCACQTAPCCCSLLRACEMVGHAHCCSKGLYPACVLHNHASVGHSLAEWWCNGWYYHPQLMRRRCTVWSVLAASGCCSLVARLMGDMDRAQLEVPRQALALLPPPLRRTSVAAPSPVRRCPRR